MGACESNNKCGSSRSRRKSYNSKIELQSLNMGIPALDQTVDELIEHLKEIEGLRRKFSLAWNDFLLESGAVVLQNPSIRSCLIGYIYRFSFELTEKNIRHLKFELTPPWFTFEEEYTITKKAKQNVKDIDAFLQFACSIQYETETLFNNYKSKFDNSKLKFEEYTYEGMKPQEKEKSIKKVTKCLEVLQLALEIIVHINDIISKRDPDLKAFLNDLSDANLLNDRLSIFKEVELKKIGDNPSVFVSKYSKEEKLHNLNEAELRKAEMRINKQEILGIQK